MLRITGHRAERGITYGAAEPDDFATAPTVFFAGAALGADEMAWAVTGLVGDSLVWGAVEIGGISKPVR
ncbi:hypothetical protein ACFCX4_18570 [Kitasatospora sp. NPDC056327]|uniref:hypothetical protein n=1 Tax=Kitasatospora sp. NPDC056327 TaxID=3345785 RepID=UPI0035DDB554